VTDLRKEIEETLQNTFFSLSHCSSVRNNLSLKDLEHLLTAVRYPLKAGGKRVRPMLTCMIAEACGTVPATTTHPAVLHCAASIELIHTYSLVHDDLPCMDNDDLRRGKPTAHKVFGEANALLIGDALLTHAFQAIFEATKSGLPAWTAMKIVDILSRQAGLFGMIGGQWKDLEHTNNPQKSHWETVLKIHRLKTGAILGAACAIGALAGLSLTQSVEKFLTEDASALNNIASAAEDLGLNIGLAFQIIDDILDATEGSTQLGKTAGKDSQQNKLTAVSLLGIEQAQREAGAYTQAALDRLLKLQQGIENLRANAASQNKTASRQQFTHAQEPPTIHKQSWERLHDFIHQLLARTS